MNGRGFTPGPWRASHGDLIRVLAPSIPGVTVCGVHKIGRHTGADHGDPLANAQLIAGAPTLLDALRLTERNLGSLIAARHCDAVLMTTWRDVVRAAITEATGETFPKIEETPHAG